MLALAGLLMAGAAAAEITAPAAIGYSVVATYPHDKNAFTQGLVYVDGKRVGKLPLTRLALSPGKHTVEIRRGKRRQRLVVQITAGETTVKSLLKKRRRRRR